MTRSEERHITRSIAAEAVRPSENGSFYAISAKPKKLVLRLELYGIDRHTLRHKSSLISD